MITLVTLREDWRQGDLIKTFIFVLGRLNFSRAWDGTLSSIYLRVYPIVDNIGTLETKRNFDRFVDDISFNPEKELFYLNGFNDQFEYWSKLTENESNEVLRDH